MDSQHLKRRLEEIEGYINDFKRTLADSEINYQMSLKRFNNPELCSSFMEQHIIHTERQKAAITRMESLYDQVLNQLDGLNESNS